MKNILIVTDYIAPYEGNFIRSLKKLEESLIDDGNNLYYVFSSKAKKIDWVLKLNNTMFLEDNPKDNLKLLNKIIKEKNIDTLYSHFCLPKTQLVVKIVTKINRKVKLYQHFHNHFDLPKNILKKIIFKYIFKGDLNIGCSKDVANTLPYKNKAYVTNAIDFSRLDNYEKIKIDKNNNFIILMFGYTYYRKGVDLAIKAISKLGKDNIILAISVSKDVESFKESIEKDFGEIPSFVKILEPRNDIATYYKASNLFLSAAREEGFCYAIVESMYCGIPCICTELPGQPNEIPFLLKIDKENVEQLKEKIELVIKKQIDFNEEQVKEYLIKTYGIDNWVEQIKELLYL